MATAANEQEREWQEERTKPPFLRRIRIKGYKSLALCDVYLQPLTVLVGRNGSGKSNFLDALTFLRDIFAYDLQEAIKRHGGQDAIPWRLGKEQSVLIEVAGRYSLAGTDDFWDAAYRIVIDFPKRQPAVIRHEHLRLQQDDWWVGYTNDNGQVVCATADDCREERTWGVKYRPFIDSYGDTPVPEFRESLESLLAYRFHPDAIRRVQKPSPGYFLTTDGGNLASVLATMKENNPSAFERLLAYLSVIAPEVLSLTSVRYGEFETVRFTLQSGSPSALLEFDAASMSDGTLRVLATLAAAFQVVLPLGHPSLIGIEEPETSLHPAAAHALVSALEGATEHTQVLLTTHSGDLLDDPKLSPASVLVTRQRGGRTEVAPVDPASREIIRQELYTLADLQRRDQLNLDEEDLERQAAARGSQEG
jgi:predicted ATPase